MTYPLATAVNFFSTTGLLIFAGLFGRAELSAEIAIAQGAVIAIFLSLSGNARNLILSDKTGKSEREILKFRLIVLLPAAFGAFYLAISIIDMSVMLILGLILRKVTEWLIEIELAYREKLSDFSFARKYIFTNIFSFLVVLIQFTLAVESMFFYALYFWALTPALFLIPNIGKSVSAIKGDLNLLSFIPHLGASSIIGATTYVFRILIVLLVGKTLAGQMFTAYALGGLVSAIYTYAIGPSIMFRNENNAGKIVFIFSVIFTLLGVALILIFRIIDHGFYSPLFIDAVGISIVGGGVMLIAQYKRLHILQRCKQDVFVPDALANILFLATIPFLYYLVGGGALSFLFLWSSMLNLAFYFVLYHKKRSINA